MDLHGCPLVVLALNLLFPRSRIVKFFMLAVLLFATLIHGLLSYVPIARAIAHHQHYGAPVFSPFLWHVILVDVFDVTLGLVLAICFALLPVDSLRRIRESWRHGYV